MTILFLHGWTSVPGGVKPTYLASHGHTVINPKLPDEDFAKAVRIAQAEFDRHKPQVVVGSSRGGAVAMNIDSGDARLVLLCPAWKRWGTATTVKPGTVILHSRADDVVPFTDSEEVAKNSGLPGSALIEVGTDHRLADQEPLERMLEACEERIIGSDFGAPASAGQQAKKIILVEAVRLGERRYSIRPTGRNQRLRMDLSSQGTWKERRPGWTIPELTASLMNDLSVRVAAFDFPFSIPLSLLNDPDFGAAVGQQVFLTRSNWSEFVGRTLQLAFASEKASAKLDFSPFDQWRSTNKKGLWVRRYTDLATGGFPPLQDKYQYLFCMTLAGTAMLEKLNQSGFTLALGSKLTASGVRVAFETYPSAVARCCGFLGSYKKEPESCFKKACEYLAKREIELEIAEHVREFCLKYRTKGKNKDESDPDGADAFLCLVAAICYREGVIEMHSGKASPAILSEEGCIVTPEQAHAL